MIIGIPKEKKDQESRVGLTPKWVGKLTAQGHEVLIEKNLAQLAGIPDDEYIKNGAVVVETTEDIYHRSEFVLKLKDYTPEERDLPFKKDQMIMCFFHLGEVEPDRPIVDKLIESQVTALSLELIQTDDGARPLIRPMSEIAGRVAMICACQYSMLPFGGSGISLSGIAGTERAKVVILGGGVCGLAAADFSEAIKAHTVIFEASYQRLEYLQTVLPHSELLLWDKDECARQIANADVLLNTIYPLPGMDFPLVTREMVRAMKKRALIVDLVGCDVIETIDYTTISNPTYIEEGVLHFAVDNLPAMVPLTSCEIFSASVYPYIEAIANKGLKRACEDSRELSRSVSFVGGKVVHPDIAATHNISYEPFNTSMLKGE